MGHPARELGRICESLSIGVDPERLEQIGREHAYESVPSDEKGGDKAIRAASPGSWRRNLTAAEQRVMHEIMGQKLAELGYAGQRTKNAA